MHDSKSKSSPLCLKLKTLKDFKAHTESKRQCWLAKLLCLCCFPNLGKLWAHAAKGAGTNCVPRYLKGQESCVCIIQLPTLSSMISKLVAICSLSNMVPARDWSRMRVIHELQISLSMDPFACDVLRAKRHPLPHIMLKDIQCVLFS